MIIARRSAPSYSVDAVALSVRTVLSTAVRSDSRTPAPPAAPGVLDLAHFYPGLYAAASVSSPSARFAVTATRALSAGAAAVIAFAAIFHR